MFGEGSVAQTEVPQGELGEYCWSSELKCTVGESFQRAYVVLPVDITTVAHEQLEVRATDPTAATLLAHDNPTTVADSCGLRYDVTPRFTTQRAGTSFCIQVVVQDDVLGDRVLRCPPFLVTYWQRNQDLANQEGE
ncbi:hypothetical protein EYF80_030615 [Liparis tanakae]|uniref:Uncharacterized protein n=1 Tax=Liparis tanakae TaxID=230148 RepID=A0A4Z2H1F2_9TELE|nr:hypothetical protein EYF80_030615 [Liparis tanakae]